MLEFMVDQVLLRRAVEPLTWIADNGTVVASLEGIKLIARITDDYDFFAVLSFRSLDFIHFSSDFEAVTGVDLNCLFEILSMLAQNPLDDYLWEEFICFHAPDCEQRTEITFINSRLIDTSHPHGIGLQLPDDPAAEEGYRNESQREYCVFAAVPSWQFRRILRLLFDVGDEVTITITETQVVFSVLHIRVTLRKEFSECIIGATSVEDYPAQVIMDTDYAGPFMLASYLSNTVWILHCDDPMALHQFNIPVQAAGNIMFYIP